MIGQTISDEFCHAGGFRVFYVRRLCGGLAGIQEKSISGLPLKTCGSDNVLIVRFV